MRFKRIRKADVPSYVEELSKTFRVAAPVKKPEGGVKFEILDSDFELALEYTFTMLPPKKFLFPPREVILEFTDSQVKLPKIDGELLLFGLHPCDINALLILDKVFSANFEDPYYWERRRKTIIVGVDCKPAETCFCKSLGTFRVEKGFDLFLRESNTYYYAYAATDVGEKLVEYPYFEEVSAEEAQRVEAESYSRYRNMVEVKVEGLPQRLDQLFEEEEIWEKLGEKCLGCGNCTMVCPVCACFNVVDEVDANLKSGRRVRTWDACTLPGFALVAGGLNFRPRIAQRVRNWIYDKFKIFVEEVGKPGCVGCGRCINYCPAGIDLREEIARLWGEMG
ncbi:MAG: 4Fe-4S dicluster domain-containing protein [Candidatus Hecatellaceae archaeon]